jgi:hypothetical protein
MLDTDADAFEIPCVPVQSAGTDVFLCDATRGPTCSWKDCVAPGVVTMARRHGARRVVVASSGNHGRAVAHACRAAGLACRVLVYDRTPADVVASLAGLGATVARLPGHAAVYATLRALVAEGWFSATLIDRAADRALMPGSPGYGRIAAAIAATVPADPIVVVPTCYGDGASAIARHLRALGVEPIMVLLRAGEASADIAASIATDIVTPQVSCLLAGGAISVMVGPAAIRPGLAIMEALMGKPLDGAEGGLPEALRRLAAAGLSRRDRPIVCVVTAGVFPGLARAAGLSCAEGSADRSAGGSREDYAAFATSGSDVSNARM